MISAGSEVAVIIVNYNTAALAIEATESVLAKSHGGRKVEVHLVDNASPNGDGAVLGAAIDTRGWEGRVSVYRQAENLGFGCGNNVVLSALAVRAQPPLYVFLLNPDARLENEAVSILADFLDARPDVAGVGARIRKPDGTPVTAAFRFPGVISTFASGLSFGPVARLLARWDVPLAPDTPTRRVDWVSGAAILLRLSAAQAAGYFDPGFFLYFEEVDLMRQMARRGQQIWHVAEAHVVHAEGAATGVQSGRRERRPAYWYQSWVHYFVKNHGRMRALMAAAGWLIGATLNAAISAVRGRQPAHPPGFFRDYWAFVARPLLGLKASANE